MIVKDCLFRSGHDSLLWNDIEAKDLKNLQLGHINILPQTDPGWSSGLSFTEAFHKASSSGEACPQQFWSLNQGVMAFRQKRKTTQPAPMVRMGMKRLAGPVLLIGKEKNDNTEFFRAMLSRIGAQYSVGARAQASSLSRA